MFIVFKMKFDNMNVEILCVFVMKELGELVDCMRWGFLNVSFKKIYSRLN